MANVNSFFSSALFHGSLLKKKSTRSQKRNCETLKDPTITIVLHPNTHFFIEALYVYMYECLLDSSVTHLITLLREFNQTGGFIVQRR